MQVSKGCQSTHFRRTECRICEGRNLELILSLGDQALANAFIESPEDIPAERRYPLDVYRCRDCTLVQLLDVISPETLFRNYIYVTGTSQTMAAHNKRYAASMVSEFGLRTDDLVVEIASNDGSFLAGFSEYNVRTLGIEPARNIAAIARANGIETVDEFFSLALAYRVRKDYGAARIVVANNVLAHVDNPKDFLTGCRELTDVNGVVVTEFPYLGDLLEQKEYDTFYHEHLSYFSVTALMRLYQAAGLVIEKVERIPVHGGSLRVFATHRSNTSGSHCASARELAEIESRLGYDKPQQYRSLSAAVSANREALLILLQSLKKSGKSIVGYGASAKGNTLLNYCGIDTSLIDYIVDQNPMKVGLYTPGMYIPVKSVSVLESQTPDYILILAWNFASEIMRSQPEFTRRGGKFILPHPCPTVAES